MNGRGTALFTSVILCALAIAAPAQATILPIDPYPDTPAAPTGFTATPGDGQVFLDWGDNNKSEPDFWRYLVYRSLDPSAQFSFVAETMDSQYTDTELANGVTYYYRVYAQDQSTFMTGTEALAATPTAPAPQRSDYKNAAQFCKAERDFLGGSDFREKYGGGGNAYGKCVSRN